MKKVILLFALALFTSQISQAQSDLRLGVNVGLPVGDIDDISSFTAGADVAYLMGMGETFQIGPMVGYQHFFTKDIDTGVGNVEIDDISFVPVAAALRFGIAGIQLGADLGYAIGIDDGNDGGFYYRPKVGFNLLGLDLLASYTGISTDGYNTGSVNLGVEFRL